MQLFRKSLYFFLFISFLCSMNIWFAWNKAGRYVSFALAILIVACVIFGRIRLELTFRNLVSFLLLAIAYLMYNFTYNSIKSLLILATTLMTFWVIISLNVKDKYDCLNFITTAFVVLMIPSLVLWLVNWFVPLPSFGTVRIDNTYQHYRPYTNHLIFVKSSMLSYGYRFNGPFLEPGHLGMMSAFLLYANKYNFKDKRLIGIIVVLLFSLSLAGYVLAAIGYCFNKFVTDKRFILRVAGVIIVIIPIYFFSLTYNGGHNFLNERIIERLQYDEDKGFSGNNRVFGQIEDYYRFLLKSGKHFWTGYDKKTMKWLAESQESRGTGYVMFVVTNGFLGLIITSLFYIYYAASSKCKKYALLYFIYVCFVFWQRCYPFWTSWLICYVWGISIYDALNYKPKHREEREGESLYDLPAPPAPDRESELAHALP